MPLTTYTAGQVLTAASLNNNFTFAASNGLTLVSDTTIGTGVASHVVTSAFSATYDNYFMTVSGGVLSAGENISFVFGATTTGYNGGQFTVDTAGALFGFGNNNSASFSRVMTGATSGYSGSFTILSPFLTTETTLISGYARGGYRGYAGSLSNILSYTGFTIAPASGTMTGGQVRVYGIEN